MAAHRYAEVGAGSVTLTVTDDDGGRASAQVEVVQPPANQAPQAENASVTAVNGAAVEINLEATDPDNGPQPLAFSIVSPPSHGRVVLLPPATLMAPAEPEAVYFPDVGYAGPDSFSFTASDGKASSNAATVALTVTAPNSPPDCSAVNATPSLLWPPNHELVEVTLTGASDPDGDVVDPAVTTVTQDEPVNGVGDGDSSPDAQRTAAANAVLLRAERSGTGDGRVYRLSFTVEDAHGASCSGTVRVGVPKSRGGAGSSPVESPLVADSFGS